jgi:hypothetical protein
VKHFSTLSVAVILVLLASSSGVSAKGMGGPIRDKVMFRDIAVVVRAHVAPDGGPAIIVDRSYYGPFKAGERVPVEKKALEDKLMVPGGGSQPEMFLVLEHVPAGRDESTYGDFLFSKGLVIGPSESLNRRLSDGRVYFWGSDTKKASYRFWSYFTNTAALTRDKDHADLTALENDFQEGLVRHDEWWRAKAEADPNLRLAMLRPFLLPGGPHHLNEYEVWSCTQSALDQVEQAGSAAVPFLQELLTEPSFQEGYAVQDWPGWAMGERDMVKRSLALVQAREAPNSQEKLTKVRPVFDTVDFFTTAGFDRHGAVRQYLDRGLAVVTSVDAAEARPFLQGLLMLPQFQKGFEPIGQTSFGEEMREKIESALNGLK